MGNYSYFGPTSRASQIGSAIGVGMLVATWTFGLGYLVWYAFIR